MIVTRPALSASYEAASLAQTPEREVARGLETAISELEKVQQQLLAQAADIGRVIAGHKDQARALRNRPFERMSGVRQ